MKKINTCVAAVTIALSLSVSAKGVNHSERLIDNWHLMGGMMGTSADDKATIKSPAIEIGYTFNNGLALGIQHSMKSSNENYHEEDYQLAENDAIYAGYQFDDGLRLTAGYSQLYYNEYGTDAASSQHYKGGNVGIHQVLENGVMLGGRFHAYKDIDEQSLSFDVGYQF